MRNQNSRESKQQKMKTKLAVHKIMIKMDIETDRHCLRSIALKKGPIYSMKISSLDNIQCIMRNKGIYQAINIKIICLQSNKKISKHYRLNAK